MAAPTRREHEVIEKRLLKQEAVFRAYGQYSDNIENYKKYVLLVFPHVNKSSDGNSSGAITDLWQCFAERSPQLLRASGYLGLVLPSAFHANESATGIRDLFLDHMAFRSCYSFENRRKLFEIHSSFKFATVIAQAGKRTDSVSCAFYLHDDEWLFGKYDGHSPLSYQLEFVRRTGGGYLSLLELRSARDLEVAEVCFSSGKSFGSATDQFRISMGQELHMSKDAWRFVSTQDFLPNGDDPRNPQVAEQLRVMGKLPLHEGKTFWHYDDHWQERPSYCVPLDRMTDRAARLLACKFYRLAHRAIASSTNERTIVFHMLPPGVVCGNSAPVERTPHESPRSHALMIAAISNSFVFDWLARVRTGANINQFILRSCPIPLARIPEVFSAHSALRLTCNHGGYEALWREQLGNTWRESARPPFSWPVLSGDDNRWQARTAIDAAVAHAYGLTHDQYAHVLSGFSHKSYLKAPELCLAMFDELKAIGLHVFTKKHDPYWDIPLNENLPQPVIDLPVAEAEQSTVGDPALGPQFRLSDKPARQRAKRKR